MNNLPYSRTVLAGKTFLSPTDYQIYIDTTDGVATVVLPKISTIYDFFQNGSSNSNGLFGYRFKHIAGNAAINKIVFEGMDDDKVNGVQKFEVTTSGASGVLLISGVNNYTFVSNISVAPPAPVNLISVTFSEITSLINSSTLSQGQFYLITDFQTIYDQPDFDAAGNPKPVVATKTGAVEPLIVLAVSTNSISKQVWSTTYPNDVIEYDISFVQTEKMGAPAKGRISLRIDNFNNRTDYDHRVVLFKRYQGKVFNTFSYKDNGGGITEFLTFASSLSKDNYIGDYAIYYDGVSNPFILSNNVLNSDVSILGTEIGNLSVNNTIISTIGNPNGIHSNVIGNNFSNNNVFDDFYKNVIGNDCVNNEIGGFSGDGTFSNRIGDLFKNNLISGYFAGNIVGYFFGFNQIGTLAVNNQFKDYCVFNTLGDEFQGNIIQSGFTSNTFGFRCQENMFGNNFLANIFGEYCKCNNISDRFNSNTIGNNFGTKSVAESVFQGNIMADDCNSNVIGNDAYGNVISNSFAGNNILNNFQNNNIGNDFDSNSNIGDNFKYNTVRTAISGVNFSLATHVYQHYSCDIFQNAGAVKRLSFFDAIDALTVVNVNS